MSPMPSIPIWLVAIVVAVSAPLIVQWVAALFETRARRRAESLFGLTRDDLRHEVRVPARRVERATTAEDVAPFRARK